MKHIICSEKMVCSTKGYLWHNASKARSAVVPFIKVNSKSLLKVGSLKGSIVYSLILDYQFCACVMRTSGVPQLQVIRMERLYGYK